MCNVEIYVTHEYKMCSIQTYVTYENVICPNVCYTRKKVVSKACHVRTYITHGNILKAKSNFTAYIYTKKLLRIFLLKSWEFL